MAERDWSSVCNCSSLLRVVDGRVGGQTLSSVRFGSEWEWEFECEFEFEAEFGCELDVLAGFVSAAGGEVCGLLGKPLSTAQGGPMSKPSL